MDVRLYWRIALDHTLGWRLLVEKMTSLVNGKCRTDHDAARDLLQERSRSGIPRYRAILSACSKKFGYLSTIMSEALTILI